MRGVEATQYYGKYCSGKDGGIPKAFKIRVKGIFFISPNMLGVPAVGQVPKAMIESTLRPTPLRRPNPFFCQYQLVLFFYLIR